MTAHWNIAFSAASFFLLLGLGLNEWVISSLKGADLSNLTLITLRLLNIYFTVIGILFAFYNYSENLRGRIKQTLLWIFTLSLPLLTICLLELGLKTWERMYAMVHLKPEDLSAEETIFRLALDDSLYGKNASPWAVSPYRPHQSAHYNINRHGLRAIELDPTKKGDSDWTIGMLGGSTVWGYNIADGNTLPAKLETFFKESDQGEVAVLNLGISGVGFAQESNVIEKFVEAELISPRQLIFYHGGNDFVKAYHYAMKGSQDAKVLYVPQDFLYTLDRVLSQSSLFSWMKFVLSLVIPNVYYSDIAVAANFRSNRLEASAQEYLATYASVVEFCRNNDMICNFFIQPLLINKENKTLTERIAANAHLNRFPGYKEYYNRYAERILSAAKPNIYDLRNVLQTDELIFSYKDIVHVNAEGNSIIANSIYRQLAQKGLTASINTGESGP